MKDDGLYLIHIHDAIGKILRYTSEGRDAFMLSPMAQDAVIRNFEIIGEAAKRLSENVSQAHPEIPWRDIAKFRDLLIHHYSGVDLDRVWNVVIQYLPALQDAIDDLLDE